MDDAERFGAKVVPLVDKTSAATPLILSPQEPLESARAFVADQFSDMNQRVLHHYRDDYFGWDRASYPMLDRKQIRARIYTFLDEAVTLDSDGNEVPFKPNRRKVDDVIDALKAITNLSANVEPPIWLNGQEGPSPLELIPCRNGLLHVPTRTMLPPNSNYFTLNAVPYAYDPEADDPVEWLRFLDSLWPDDSESIETLQDVMGYSLTCDTAQHKIFMIEGPKRAGKGTIARVHTQLLGPANVCAPTLASLGTNFGLSPLIGKQLAIISDARLGERANQSAIAERLLSISGEDALTVDRKYRDAWTGHFAVRFIILTNELPRLTDASGALVSRFILLKLTESFYGREDLGLTKRLLTELPGILNWAIDGADRLRERGAFKQPTSALEALQELEDLSSPVGEFVRTRCEVGPACQVSVDDLYAAWKTWCEENGWGRASTRQIFGKDLAAVIRGLRIKRPHEGEDRKRVYHGIGLKP